MFSGQAQFLHADMHHATKSVGGGGWGGMLMFHELAHMPVATWSRSMNLDTCSMLMHAC